MPLYTPEQATATLPLVRRIVEDLVRIYAQWQHGVDDFEVASLRSQANRPDPQAEAAQARTQELATEIDGYVRELSALGIECTGFAEGAVVFPTMIEGFAAVLSWRLGEPAVEHWHERGHSIDERRPVTAVSGGLSLSDGGDDHPAG